MRSALLFSYNTGSRHPAFSETVKWVYGARYVNGIMLLGQIEFLRYIVALSGVGMKGTIPGELGPLVPRRVQGRRIVEGTPLTPQMFIIK